MAGDVEEDTFWIWNVIFGTTKWYYQDVHGEL